jgi:asparagine synthase (glutamine-hydrolysing)
MCGIAGFVNKKGKLADRSVLAAMTHVVRHRGPDGDGHYICDNIALGHRRLAIIDLSEAANQPMHSTNGRLTIVFNGEIYNYIEIRQELQQLGHQFRTQSDTEVILEAYAEWGSDCVQHFNGMWAFALYDQPRKLLFCSRDRFGVKPFYYVNNGDVFAFGSEIKQLLDFLPRREANREVLETFLLTGLFEYSEESFFTGVKKLQPSHNLFMNAMTGLISIERYYEPALLELEGTGEEELERRLLDILTSSVELRLRSDVPVGTCLSGGLDSSSIATLAASRYNARTGNKFFGITAVSSEAATDESGFARQIVNQNGMNWLTIRPTQKDFADALASMAYHQDEPIPTLSPMMQYFVMRKARENEIPVLLDGQGADEILLGYIMYFGMYLRSTLRERGVTAAARELQQGLLHNQSMSLGAAIKYMVGVGTPRMRYFRSRCQSAWLKCASNTPQVLLDGAAARGDLRSFQLNEIGSATLPGLLHYEDRNSMAFSIETRLPFLDYRLVELCLSMPLRSKMRDGWTKWTLRRAMSGVLPESIAWRRDKIGFEAPETQWMHEHEEVIRQRILSSELVRFVTHERILKPALRWMSPHQLWRLFSVALWSGQFGVCATGESTAAEPIEVEAQSKEVRMCTAESAEC